jgi:hypothetical protein
VVAAGVSQRRRRDSGTAIARIEDDATSHAKPLIDNRWREHAPERLVTLFIAERRRTEHYDTDWRFTAP